MNEKDYRFCLHEILWVRCAFRNGYGRVSDLLALNRWAEWYPVEYEAALEKFPNGVLS